MIIEDKRITKFTILAFIVFLVTMYHWAGWKYQYQISLFISFCMSVFCIKNNDLFEFRAKNIVSFSLMFLAYLYAMAHWRFNFFNLAFYNQFLSFGLPILYTICLRKEQRIIVFEKIYTWFAYLMLPAILLYFITLFVNIPSLGIVDWGATKDYEEFYGVAYNYLFMLKPISHASEELFSRFRGPFLEPGHLGMICAFLLLGKGFDYKNRASRIIIFSLLLTLSLAGYVLGLIAVLINYITTNTLKLRTIAVPVILILFTFLFTKNFQGGDNYLNKMILNRLVQDEETGIVGNDRASATTIMLYEAMLNDPTLLLYGYDKTYIESYNVDREVISGAGYVYFVVRRGLIALLLAFSFYAFWAINAKNKKYALLAFFFILLSFWQRDYFFWYSWVLCYIVALDRFDYRTTKYNYYEPKPVS